MGLGYQKFTTILYERPELKKKNTMPTALKSELKGQPAFL